MNLDYVDLGLPSGTLWAKCNLGAKKETDPGLFFQWGDIEGYKGVDKHRFDWTDYKWGTRNNLIKYNEIDGLTILQDDDDAIFIATNGKMRTPTKEQCQELIGYTNHEWISIDDVKGIKLSSKIDSSKYIFIPSAGDCYDGKHNFIDSLALIWSASHSEFRAIDVWYMYFTAVVAGVSISSYRYYGFSLRGVLNK
jgi:hypothetical protein